MPLPEPKKNQETRSQWMQRCMSNAIMQDEFPKTEQRKAVCLSIWQDSDKSSSDLVQEGMSK